MNGKAREGSKPRPTTMNRRALCRKFSLWPGKTWDDELCHAALKWGLLHSRCSLRDKGEVKLLKLLGVQTFSGAAAATLSRAVPPDWILTRAPRVTACRDRHFAPRVKQTPVPWDWTPAVVSISIQLGPQICIQQGPLFGTGRNDSARPGAAVRLAQPGRVRCREAGL